jgi:hypothetical protein
MQELVGRIKNSVFDLSEEDVEINRKEHVAACRQALNYGSNKGKKRKAPTCSNCGRPGHKKPECEEPSYDEKHKSKRRKGLLSEAQLIDLFDV